MLLKAYCMAWIPAFAGMTIGGIDKRRRIIVVIVVIAHYTFAMTDISFYHLTSTTLDQALPKLLEKALQGGFKAVVRAGSDTEAERLCGLLWSYDQDSFLPH